MFGGKLYFTKDITHCAHKIQHILNVLTAHQVHQELLNRSSFPSCASS